MAKRRTTRSVSQPAEEQVAVDAIYANPGQVPYQERNKFRYRTLETIDRLFGCRESLERDLRRLGLNPRELRFQVEEKPPGAVRGISKTSRGFAAINVYRRGEEMGVGATAPGQPCITNTVARYLVKTSKRGEKTSHDLVQRHEMVAKIIHTGTRTTREGGKRFHIERYMGRGSGVLDVGPTLDDFQATRFGEIMARHLYHMIQETRVYDFSKFALTHTRIILGREDPHDMRVILLDPGNFRDISGEKQGNPDEFIVNQLRDIARICRTVSHVSGPVVWRAFADTFSHISEVDPHEDRASATVRAQAEQERQQRITAEVVRQLTAAGDEEGRHGWRTFFGRAAGLEPPATRELKPVEKRLHVHVDALAERLRELGEPRLGKSIRAIVSNTVDCVNHYNQGIGHENQIDPLRIGFLAEKIDVDGGYAIRVTVLKPEPEQTHLVTYNIRLGEAAKAAWRAARMNVGEPVIYANRRKTKAVIRHEGVPLKDYANAPPHQCEFIGESMADLLARAVRREITYHHRDNIVVTDAEGNPYTRAGRYKLGDRWYASDIRDNIKKAATFFMGMQHGQVAWKVFSATLPASATSEKEAVAYTRALAQVDSGMGSHPGWTGFRDAAKAVMWDDPQMTELHQTFLGYLKGRPPLTSYSDRNLPLLESLEPPISECIERLRREGVIDCPWASAPHVHIAVPLKDRKGRLRDKEDVHCDARRGRLENVGDFAIVVDAHRYRGRVKTRHRDRAGERILFRLEGGMVVDSQRVPRRRRLEEFGYTLPPGFVAYLEPTGRGMGYSLWWDKRQFSGVKGKRRERMMRENTLEERWLSAEQIAVSEYKNPWPIIEGCRRRLDGLRTFDDKFRFVVGVDVSDRISSVAPPGLVSALNPKSPRFLEDDDFRVYAQAPEVLDRTIETSYPNFRGHAEDFLTALSIMPLVHEREMKLGSRLNIEEYRRLMSGHHRVRLGGDKPSDYIRGLTYMKNLRRYVVGVMIRDDGGRDHQLVVKRENMAQDLVVSSICEVLGLRSSRIWPASPTWGMEAFSQGSTPLDDPAACSRFPQEFAFEMGKYAATVACLNVTPHWKNVVVDDRGRTGLIDLEVDYITPETERWYPNGEYVVSEGCMLALQCLSQWNPKERPSDTIQTWNSFCKGVRTGQDTLMEELGFVERILDTGVRAGQINLDVKEVMRRLEISPERKIRNAVRCKLESLAKHGVMGNRQELDAFLGENPAWPTILKESGLSVQDLRIEEIVSGHRMDMAEKARRRLFGM